MFFTCGLIGLKMSSVLRSCENAKSTGQLRRISPAPIWMSEPPVFDTSQLPPGFVPASQFSPPPPAYNQINLPVNCLPVRITSAPPAYDRIFRSVYPQQLCTALPDS
ncbi:unnamed protein product [Enterobius vermicularis]|uniref:Ovule protein n=1 Tax=Enterobius vermicularis TaxID=51028 RepID=A0A0N4VQL1_ENTVE|nr:unnamed protein product [Enterobius vermicularis]